MNHRSTDNSCPILKKHQQIKNLQVREGVSFKDAVSRLKIDLAEPLTGKSGPIPEMNDFPADGYNPKTFAKSHDMGKEEFLKGGYVQQKTFGKNKAHTEKLNKNAKTNNSNIVSSGVSEMLHFTQREEDYDSSLELYN